MYRHLAHLYDSALREEIARATLDDALRQLCGRGIAPPGWLIDLACGTGWVTRELVRRGWHAEGIDLSEPMLAIARERSDDEGLQVSFRCEDIRTVRRDVDYSAVLCFGDVVNHLLDPDDVRALFERAFDLLGPGGAFVFDVNTLENFESALWNVDETEVGDHSIAASFDRASGIARLQCRQGDVTDLVEERFYRPQDILQWLDAVGFIEVISHPLNAIDLSEVLPDLTTQKLLWVATRG